MKKILLIILTILFSLNAQALFEVKDASDNTVLEISNDGLRVFNEGDTLMVISSSEIKAFIDSSTTKALSRSFSVTTSAASGKDALSNAFEVTTRAAQFNSGLGRYTNFSPENIFMGLNAGINTEPYDHGGHSNVFLGNDAGVANQWGQGNVFIGMNAGKENVMGGTSVMIGAFAGQTTSQSEENTFVGFRAGGSSGGGDQNVYLGASAGGTFGWMNVMLGNYSGSSNSGDGNIFIGYASGADETGSNKLYIANSNTTTPLIKGTFPNVDLDLTATNINLNGTLNSSTSGNNYLRISSMATAQNSGIDFFREGAGLYDWRIYNTGGSLKFGTSGDELETVTDRFQIAFSTGNVGIGSTSPGQKLDIYGGYGRVESGYSWLTSSDIRYKTNVTTLGNALENVKKIRGVRYDLKVDKDIVINKGKHIGFIAQELEKVYDELVVDDDNGYKSVAYDKVTAVLVEAMKEQQEKIENLESKLNELEDLRSEIEEIKKLLNK